MVLVLVVSGSRGFDNYNLFEYETDSYIERLRVSTGGFDRIQIVSGGARGADNFAEKYAKEHGYELRVFKADWSLGKGAGMIRNKEMLEYACGFKCSALISFWDGKSHGTANTINLANELNIDSYVVEF